jgi:hypothetical protein
MNRSLKDGRKNWLPTSTCIAARLSSPVMLVVRSTLRKGEYTMKKFHFFIPTVDENQNLGIIHWSDTIESFQGIVVHKREVENILNEDRQVRVLNPETMLAADVDLSNLMECQNDSDVEWYF